MNEIKCTLLELNYATQTVRLDFDTPAPVDYLPFRMAVEGLMVVIYAPAGAYHPTMLRDIARQIVGGGLARS